MISERAVIGWLLCDPKKAIERIQSGGFRFKYKENANYYRIMRECYLDGDVSLVAFFERLKPVSVSDVLAFSLYWTDWQIEKAQERIKKNFAAGLKVSPPKG